ncbi:hypothetical protein GCM10010401_09030 [Rarobacter faecitabidus]|uniref:Uncharacterized protein n=1 Tax=Rarobacter faecitabidus TaxID=13243 RepID=A0A542ZAY2_RARFA|nr:hypothetical protein [Rarobacter faecitabidus]TQL57503.1 hypothetical protein FB461_2244 [Rarobacter faecitabidus]
MTVRIRALASGLAALVMAAAAVLAPACAEAVSPTRSASPTVEVIVAVTGLSWEEVAAHPDAYPTIAGFAPTALVAQAVATNGTSTSCPADGFLTLATGTRVADRLQGSCRRVDESIVAPDGRIAGWDELVAEFADQPYAPRAGLLAATLRGAGLSVAAVGGGGALVLADEAGRPPPQTTMPKDDAELRAAVAAGVRDASLTVVDVARGGAAAGGRELDARFAAVLAGVAAGGPARVTLVSVGGADDSPASMQFFARAAGAGVGGDLATSTSTRQPGLILTTDVQPTVLAGFDLVADGALGAPVRPAVSAQDPAGRVEALLALAQRSQAGDAAAVPYVYLVAGLGVAMLGLAAARWRRSGARLALRTGGLAIALVPMATYLASASAWWRTSSPLAAIAALASLIVVAVATLLMWLTRRTAEPWAGRVIAVAALTWLVIVVDVLRGTPWMTASPLGTQPLQAGRFYGVNNTAFSFFAVATLTLIVMLGPRLVRRNRVVGIACAAAFGLASCAIDALPGVGADFGGALALIPGVALTVTYVAGLRMTIRRVLVVIGLGVAAALGIGWLDSLRGAGERTHLGDFVAHLGTADTLTVIGRKLGGATRPLLDNPLLGLVAVVLIAVAIWVMRRWRAHAAVGEAGIAVVITCVIATLLNDSGLSIAGWMGLFGGALVLMRHGALPSAVPGARDVAMRAG